MVICWLECRKHQNSQNNSNLLKKLKQEEQKLQMNTVHCARKGNEI